MNYTTIPNPSGGGFIVVVPNITVLNPGSPTYNISAVIPNTSTTSTSNFSSNSSTNYSLYSNLTNLQALNNPNYTYTPPNPPVTPVTPVTPIPPIPPPPPPPTITTYNFTIPSDNNTYQLITDYLLRADFTTYDLYARNKVPQLSKAKITNVWLITGPTGGYKIQYTLADGNIIEVIVTKDMTNKLILTSTVTNTMNVVERTSYQTWENYLSDIYFRRVDERARSILVDPTGATIESVMIQFNPNSTNYRIQYRLANGTRVSITVSRSNIGDTLNII